MNKHISTDQDFILWLLLGQTKDIISGARDRELRQYSIKPRQAAVLYIIKILESIGERITPNNISRRILREPHTVTRILTRMQKEGLITKIKNSIRINEIDVILTAKGEQAYKHTLKRESIRKTMSCLSEEERQQLSSILTKLRKKGLQDISEPRQVLFPIIEAK